MVGYEQLLNEKIDCLEKKIFDLEKSVKLAGQRNNVLTEQKNELLEMVSKSFRVTKEDVRDYIRDLKLTAIDYGLCFHCHRLDCFGDCQE